MAFGSQRDFKKPDFKKVNDYVWDIPTSFKPGMRVPGRIFMTKKLLDAADLQVFDQITNVATLPGIVRAAMCMSDGHSGYGFPIGGVAAMDIENGGVISPGGIGFDINCLPPDTRISLENGTWKRIEDMEKSWESESIVSLELADKKIKTAKALLFLKRQEDDFLYEITTASGRKIRVTEDHPLLTETGMTKAKDLVIGSQLHVRPFSGVEHEDPSSDIIVSWKEVEKVLDEIGVSKNGNGRGQMKAFLNERGLDEIRYNSPQLPALLRLMGFIFGDGSISFYGAPKKGGIQFYAKTEDLEQIKKDLQRLGMKTQRIYSRDRTHKINTYYGLSEFKFTETSLCKKSTALAALLVALGTPYGVKTSKAYRVPKWIMKAQLWQKRQFLASFFGAELSSPKTINKYNFMMPQLNMNKRAPLKENAEEFLNDIRMLLLEFGISSAYPVSVEGYQYNGKGGKTVGLRLSINGSPTTLIKLYELVGFEYNIGKSKLAALASNYLRLKERVCTERRGARNAALQMYNDGMRPKEIRDALCGVHVSDNFITHSIWPDRSDDTRVPRGFISFEQYKERLAGETVRDEVLSIDKVPYRGYVYDFTMNDKDHNFVADSIISSNCGMRLMRTNLTFDEIEPKLKQLVDQLYDRVPAGVGSAGFVKLTAKDFREVISTGSEWCIKKGYGWEEDLGRTEENGNIEGADESKVSDKAIKRGLEQVGTLGSGNHYLEIQVVKKENIYDAKAAKAMGIFPDQVVIMFHCGSRGFGHQVATDYLDVFLQVMEKKYGIKILDKELACAPFTSKEGQEYFAAMKCGINMSFANRQVIAHRIREVFSSVLNRDAESMDMHQIYDVSHNTAKLETYDVDGKKKKLLVHRKGATRALGPGNPLINKEYRDLGQPVIIGGSMETGSYLLLGTKGAEEQTFGSTAHGAGRTMSRTAAKKRFHGETLSKDMLRRGIYVKSVSYSGLAEEAGGAYKSVDEVIDAAHNAGISKKVVKFSPVGNVKGNAKLNFLATAIVLTGLIVLLSPLII